ncbi:MAG TPA: hypothetical protein PKH77_06690 [Anaerolineae bacterium]|nr:hypothetical protein [Anaerolineae bacterium]
MPEPFRRVSAVADLLPGESAGLYTACDGTLWLATDQGIAKLEGNAWIVQLTGLNGTLAGVDGAGHIWVIDESHDEISAWDGNGWATYGADAGWVSMAGFWYADAIHWGQCDPAGRFWLATSQDIRVFDGERWTVFTSQDMGMGEVPDPNGCAPSFQMTILKSTGAVWVGECDHAEGPCGGQGARWFDGQVWHGADSPASQGCVAALQEDPAGNVWLGIHGALWQHIPSSGAWTSFAPPEEVPYDYRSHAAILDLAADPFGRLWVTELLCGAASCDAQALYHVRDGVWTLVPRGADEYYVLMLRTITDVSGATWLFGDDIYRLTETDFGPSAGFRPMSAVMDTTGSVWFITREYPQDMLCIIDTDK